MMPLVKQLLWGPLIVVRLERGYSLLHCFFSRKIVPAIAMIVCGYLLTFVLNVSYELSISENSEHCLFPALFEIVHS